MIPTHDVSIDTDAGPWGWGGYLRTKHAGGFWSNRQLRNLSQNHKELLGVFFTLQAFQDELVGKTVLVQTDNKSVISYLMKGGGRSDSLSLKVFDWCQSRSIRLRCVHLRGILNVRADGFLACTNPGPSTSCGRPCFHVSIVSLVITTWTCLQPATTGSYRAITLSCATQLRRVRTPSSRTGAA